YLLSYTALAKDIDGINENLDLSSKAKIVAGRSGDYKSDGSYNEQLAVLGSNKVKRILDPHINDGGQGFCVAKASYYISNMMRDEISEDSGNMYNYLVGGK